LLLQNVTALESRMLKSEMDLKIDLRPTWSAVDATTQDELMDYRYLPLVIDCDIISNPV
jgi:hypothetical protein